EDQLIGSVLIIISSERFRSTKHAQALEMNALHEIRPLDIEPGNDTNPLATAHSFGWADSGSVRCHARALLRRRFHDGRARNYSLRRDLFGSFDGVLMRVRSPPNLLVFVESLPSEPDHQFPQAVELYGVEVMTDHRGDLRR